MNFAPLPDKSGYVPPKADEYDVIR